ncbi:hypothetical protein F5Y12DRAFT_504961 [Xylaria sp. FL1777]|nr:hypothetical protein F5Y12DRAFT_504961 [Xylaria sp. FL1777]
MASPNWIDGTHLAPPSTPKMSLRSPQNVTQSIIMIEPTTEYQRFYNQSRREMDRQRLELHVAENNLEPPQAELMSRSTTTDSHPSPSTVCSHAGDSVTPLSPDPTAEAVRSKPHRGRRKGPLDMETRIRTAFKRKFKLTCAFHRAKRTSCNCFDFSKLEEGYHKSLATEGQKAKASRSQSVRSLGDLGTFGTGGAGATGLTIPQYQSFDLPDLSTDREPTPHVHASLIPVLGLDIHSEASVNAIVSAHREDPFFLPPVAPTPISMQDTNFRPVFIGRSTEFRSRWECKYEIKTEETGSQHSTDLQCPWTGPFEQLCDHFSTAHHPFLPALEPQWSLCDGCPGKRMSPGWEDEGCHPGKWRMLFFGAVSCRQTPNPPMLAVSEASGSRSSWLNPSWNMATIGSSNTEQSHHPYSSSTSRSGFYEHSTSGNENSEADDGEEKDDVYSAFRGTQNRYRVQSDAVNITRHCCTKSWFSLRGRETGASSAFHGPHLSLTLPSKPYRRLILSLLAPLIVFHLRRAHLFNRIRCTLLAFLATVYCVKLYIALSMVLGPLVAWIALGSLRSRANGEDGLRALAPVI